MSKKFTIFIGKRILPDRVIKKIERNLIKDLQKHISEGAEIFCTSGAIGFETAAAHAVIRLRKRKRFRHIQLILLDFGHSQGLYWNAESRRVYEKIRDAADQIIPILDEDAETDAVLQRKVLEEADVSACCVYCLPDERDGSAALVDYAWCCGCKVIAVQRKYWREKYG